MGEFLERLGLQDSVRWCQAEWRRPGAGRGRASGVYEREGGARQYGHEVVNDVGSICVRMSGRSEM